MQDVKLSSDAITKASEICIAASCQVNAHLVVQHFSASFKFKLTHARWQVGSEGGAEEPALRHWWRGRMGTSKQEQLDLFMGRTESDEDSSDADDVQNSGREALQAAHSSHIDATHASVNGAYELPQGLSCACQSADTLHTGTAHMHDAFARDYTSATVEMLARGTDTDISSSDADIGSSDADIGSSDADISSSDADTSSSSESDGSFESSDDDPDSMPPVQV